MAQQPSRSTAAGRAYNDLRNLARRVGHGFEELIVTHVHEGFLVRLAGSGYRDRFLLKGGMLLAAIDTRRVTRDIDALVRGVAGSTDELLACVKEVAAHAVDDGVVFRVDQARSRSIRDDATYPGTRVTMPVNVGPARTKFTIDISIGDPVVPGPRPVEMPLLLGGVVRLLGYPAEAVLAEKIVTAVSLGELSTRVRDYADVWRLTRTRDLDGRTVTEAVRATAAYRGVALRRLSEVVGALSDRQQVAYQRWYDRQRSHAAGYPDRLRLVVSEVTTFADPVLDGSAADRRWRARTGRWEDPAPGAARVGLAG